jgi:hypothetical protein
MNDLDAESLDISQLKRHHHVYEFNKTSAAYGKLAQSFVYQKLAKIGEVFDWFDMTYPTSERNAYRLLTLEMWCQLQRNVHEKKGKSLAKICRRRPDFTARAEYWESTDEVREQ